MALGGEEQGTRNREQGGGGHFVFRFLSLCYVVILELGIAWQKLFIGACLSTFSVPKRIDVRL
jgi:hypothetical protein